MNRRNFLKRIAAVAAGAVVVPTVAKTLLFKSDHARRLIIGEHDGSIKERHCASTIWDEIPKHPVGTRYYTADGRVYVYVKSNRFMKVGGLYANCPRCKRTDLHDHTRCPA